MRPAADRPRGGTALVAVVCLSIIALVVAALFRVHASRADQVRRIEWSMQADRLIESGFERAFIQLSDDPMYDGESWSIPAEALGGRPAAVEIAVEADDEDGPRSVLVRADYPADGSPSDRVRLSKRFRIHATPPAEEDRE